MAVGVTAIISTPSTAKIKATGSGGGGVAAVPRATFLGLLADTGPLRQLFESKTGSAFAALVDDDRVSVSVYVRTTGGTPVTCGFGLDSSNAYFAVNGNFEAIVELRFLHSAIR